MIRVARPLLCRQRDLIAQQAHHPQAWLRRDPPPRRGLSQAVRVGGANQEARASARATSHVTTPVTPPHYPVGMRRPHWFREEVRTITTTLDELPKLLPVFD